MILRWSSPFRLVAALARAISYLCMGRPVLAPMAVLTERETICDECPENTREPTPQCRACTCFIEAKVLLASESCPRGYWKRLTFSRKLRKTGDTP